MTAINPIGSATGTTAYQPAASQNVSQAADPQQAETQKQEGTRKAGHHGHHGGHRRAEAPAPAPAPASQSSSSSLLDVVA
jgi:hypothetical protein